MTSPDRRPLDARQRVRLVAAILRETARSWVDDDAQRHGAALAYYTLFSVAPLLVLAVSIAGLLYDRDTARAELAARLHELLGPQGAGVVLDLLGRALPAGSGIASTVIGGVTLVIGASSVFVQLRGSFDRIWRVRRARTGLGALVCRQGVGIGMVLVVGAFLLGSLVLSTVVSGAATTVAPLLHLTPKHLSLATQAVTFVLATGLFATLFKVLPDTRVAWRHAWVGAIVTAILFAVGRTGIALYLGFAGVASAYGAAGSLVAFLVWVYWTAQIVLFGAELAAACGRRMS